MKYTLTCSCGHEVEVDLYGAMKSRQWRAEKIAEGLCDECAAAEAEAKAAATIKAYEEGLELPELIGTDEQVKWARLIRAKFMERYELIKGEYKEFKDENFAAQAEQYFLSQKEARFWIQRRDNYSLKDYINAYSPEALEKRAAERREAEAAAAALKEATLIPAEKATNDTAEIRVLGNNIHVYSPKNETIIDTLKVLGYRWNRDSSVWVMRCLYEPLGDINERLAETGAALLNAGVPVIIHDSEARRRAIEGDYQPRQKRWITRHDAGKYLRVYWEYRGEGMYEAAKALPGACYDSQHGCILVAARYFREIADFAEMYAFSYTTNAKKAIEAAKVVEEEAKRVTPKKKKVLEKSPRGQDK